MSNDFRNIDPAWLRGMTSKRVSRRNMLKAAGVGAGALSLSSILAACGTPGQEATQTPRSPVAWARPSGGREQEAGDVVNFTNWPAYLDIAKDEDGNRIRPSLDKFTEATGIEVEYRADINSNEEFYAAIRPAMEAGQDTGHDIIVITNGQELSEMMALGYLIPLDHSLTPNFKATSVRPSRIRRSTQATSTRWPGSRA